MVLYICGGLHGEWKIVGYLGLWWMVGNMNEKSEMHAIETIEFWMSTFVKKYWIFWYKYLAPAMLGLGLGAPSLLLIYRSIRTISIENIPKRVIVKKLKTWADVSNPKNSKRINGHRHYLEELFNFIFLSILWSLGWLIVPKIRIRTI